MRTVRLSGDLDIYALPQIERTLAGVADEHVVLDVGSVRLVSAAFFGALVRLRKRLPESRIEVRGATPEVKHVFRLVHADTLVIVS